MTANRAKLALVATVGCVIGLSEAATVFEHSTLPVGGPKSHVRDAINNGGHVVGYTMLQDERKTHFIEHAFLSTSDDGIKTYRIDDAIIEEVRKGVANGSKESKRIQRECIGNWRSFVLPFGAINSNVSFRWKSIALAANGSAEIQYELTGSDRVVVIQGRYEFIHKGTDQEFPGRRPAILVFTKENEPDGVIALVELTVDYDSRVSGSMGVVLKFSDLEGNEFLFIRSVQSRDVFVTLAGPLESPGAIDGTGREARFAGPQGLAMDVAGNLYVADSWNHTIRKIACSGSVTTLAGLLKNSGSTDGIGSKARFSFPSGVAADSSGCVYVADTENHTIRKISPNGSVTTLAGLAANRGSADGVGGVARFSFPSGVAVDSAGFVYVGDRWNHTIRRISLDGEVTTLAGSAGTSGSFDGAGSLARFSLPSGVAVDGTGNLYVADSGNHTIRKVTAGGQVSTLAGLAGCAGDADG